MRKFALGLILALVSTAANATPQRHRQAIASSTAERKSRWILAEKKDPFTDERIVVAVNPNDTYGAEGGVQAPLLLTCSPSNPALGVTLSINPGNHFPHLDPSPVFSGYLVKIRFDDSDIQYLYIEKMRDGSLSYGNYFDNPSDVIDPNKSGTFQDRMKHIFWVMKINGQKDESKLERFAKFNSAFQSAAKLRISFDEYSRSPLTLSYDLTGSNEALEYLAENCPRSFAAK